MRSASRSSAASNCRQADNISALSPSFPRNFSYPGICFSHLANAASHSASLLKSEPRSHVSCGLTLLRLGRGLALVLVMFQSPDALNSVCIERRVSAHELHGVFNRLRYQQTV